MRIRFDALNFVDDLIQGGGHELVHLFRLMPLNEIRRVAIASEQLIQLFMANAGKNTRICNLVAVQVEDWQNDSVGRGIQEFVGMPARRKWSGLRFAIADHTGDDQTGVIKGSPIGMRKRIA